MVEIVEHSGDVPDDSCLDFFWNDLADANEATVKELVRSSRINIDEIPGVSGASFAGYVSGNQAVTKGRQEGEQARNVVAISLGVIRLPHKTSDVLISSNAPLYISPVSPMH